MERIQSKEEKILSIIDEEVLNRSVKIPHGDHVLFREYLIKEVIPYLPDNVESVYLKNGLRVSLKEFIEESVLYTCQTKYNGEFMRFAANDTIGLVKEKEKVVESDVQAKLDEKGEIYAFCENYDLGRPLYCVQINGHKVTLSYKDGNFVKVMSADEEKEFLKRIHDIDYDLFYTIQEKSEVFKRFVRGLVDTYLEVDAKDEIDAAVDAEIASLNNLIEGYNAFGKKESFDSRVMPAFDPDYCVNIIVGKGRLFYSEFTADADSVMTYFNFKEKVEYLISEYLEEKLNKIFLDYMAYVNAKVGAKEEVVLDEEFISNSISPMFSDLSTSLEKIFVNPTGKTDISASQTYIDISINQLKDYVSDYERKVNEAVICELDAMGVRHKFSEEQGVSRAM